jgi:hypothetical protein
MRCAGGMSEFPLVEPEGVNAGSAEEVAEDERPAPPEATRGGGDPEEAPGPFAATDPADPDTDGEMVGTGNPQEESGQDAGSAS